MKERYRVTGMTCSACSSHVEKSVSKLEGVEMVSVNLLTETMDVEYDKTVLKGTEIVTAVEKAGYGAALFTGRTSHKGKEKSKAESAVSKQNMKWRLGISIGFLLPLMYVAMQHHHDTADAMNYALTQFLLVLPILYMNRKFFRVGFTTLVRLSPNMDSLIALGASAAVGYGIFAMYRMGYGLGHGDMALVEQYSHDLYFESAGMILTLITVGKYLEEHSKGKTSEAIRKMMDLSPKTAIILGENGEEKEVLTEQVRPGDVFLIKPGGLIPVDGVVLEGVSGVDESAITGESVPVAKQAGDNVVAATLNKAGFLKCRAEKVGEDTTLAQIIRLVEEAGAKKAPIAGLADKVAGIFVPVVMGISLITLLVWLVVGAGAEFAISSAIAVLVISCPCALGLATPVAIMVGTGVGAGHGILLKSGEAIQRAKEIDTVVLDKTGTITAGKLKVRKVLLCSGRMKEAGLLQIAASLEKKSEHPLAEAIVERAREEKLELTEAEDFQAVFGRGVEGLIGGKRYYVGNQAYLEEKGIAIKEWFTQIGDMADQGMTPLLVAEESELLGVIGVEDEIRETSKTAITQWRKMGIRVMMLTGDNKRTAEAVRKKLELEDVVAELLPQDKERMIREIKEQGHRVAMIGDGINDAPALAAADVGMAIGAGTDVAMESADIVLIKNDLSDAVTAMKLSRSVVRNIKQNLFWAFFYNSVGIPLAAGVWYPVLGVKLSPMFGAAAMSLSSIFVVGNALRLRNFAVRGERRQGKPMTKIITIEGMMCGHCTGRVQKALEGIPGVAQVTMSLEEKTATVELTETVAEDVLVAAVTDAGYEVIKVS